MIVVISRADISVTTDGKGQCTVARASAEVILLCPGIRIRVVLPGIRQIRRLILLGTGGDIPFPIQGE